MADVVKTLKIKKAGTPGTLPPPEDVPDAVPVAEGQPAAPVQGSHVALPKYAQIQASGPVVKDTRQWTAWAIVATLAVVAMLTLLVFQLLELKFYADPPSVWIQQGMF